MQIKGAFIRTLSTDRGIALYRVRTSTGEILEAVVKGNDHPKILRGTERLMTGHFVKTDAGRKFIVENIEM